MFGVPHTSGAVTLTYARPQTTVSATLTYADKWVFTDDVRYFNDLFVLGVFSNPYRSYWMTYPAIARVRLALSQQLSRNVGAFAQVENLTNQQVGERENTGVAAGRVTTIGLRFKY